LDTKAKTKIQTIKMQELPNIRINAHIVMKQAIKWKNVLPTFRL
jgi:hypothetical protein